MYGVLKNLNIMTKFGTILLLTGVPLLLWNNNISYCDAPIEFQLGLQDPATPIAEGIVSFHNHLIAFIIGIGFFVFKEINFKKHSFRIVLGFIFAIAGIALLAFANK